MGCGCAVSAREPCASRLEQHDRQNKATLDAVRKDSNKELILLSAAEKKRWLDGFKPLIQAKAEEADKAGLPGRALVAAYGLLG